MDGWMDDAILSLQMTSPLLSSSYPPSFLSYRRYPAAAAACICAAALL